MYGEFDLIILDIPEAGIGIVELYVRYLRKKLSSWLADQSKA
ncbi:hypothetical protein [Paenibacillus faecalis]|nr:hypothetical protein [Paenibacillus faecalis]